MKAWSISILSIISSIIISCSPKKKDRIEWNELIDKYSQEKKDSLKLEAVFFIKENIEDLKSEVLVFYNKNTKKVIDIRLDTISSEASLKRIIKDKHLAIKSNIVPDSMLLNTDQIAQTIDSALSIWKRNPWKMNIPKDVLFNNLLPYKVLYEYPEAWRSYFSKRFAGSIPEMQNFDSLRYSKDAIDLLIEQKIIWLDTTQMLRPGQNRMHLARHPGLNELRSIKSGDCNSAATKNTYLYRALGIPAAVDFTKQYGGGNSGHATAVFWDDSTRGFRPKLGDGQGFNPEYKLAKSFRLSFKKQNIWVDSILPAVGSSLNFGITHLKNDHWYDVTDEHVTTSDISIQADDTGPAYAYICTYTTGRWIPIYWGRRIKNQFIFRKMGREVLYQIALPNNGGYKLTGQIILLDSLGRKQITIKPDREKTKSLVLQKINYGRLAWVKKGSPYTLKYLDESGNWQTFEKKVAHRDSSITFRNVPDDTFYLLVKNDDRPLERPFTFSKRLVWY